MSKTLDQRLEAIEAMQPRALREEWERAYGTPSPGISTHLLRMGLAWRLQEKSLGGFSRAARHVLAARDYAKAAQVQRRRLTPGTRLVRDWHDEGHTVTVLEEGFLYDNRSWPSLTAIARHITGAKWSGPRFFGLTGSSS